jgi:hypothetical protein
MAQVLIGAVLGGSVGVIIGGILSSNTVDAKNEKINRLQNTINKLKKK